MRMDLGSGSHRRPAYYEWWYFHFVTPDGVAINMVLHETDILGLSDEPYISLTTLLPGQKPRYYRRALSAPSRRMTAPYLTNDLIEETSQRIRFDVTFSDDVRFSGEVMKLAPPLAISDGLLYQDKATGCTSHWTVQAPHATFHGILEVGSDRRQLSGYAYQDHQWGDVPLQAFVSDWAWGHFSNDQSAMVFFTILTRWGERIGRTALILPTGVWAGNTEGIKELAPPASASPATSTISLLDGLITLTIPLSPQRLMRQRLNERHAQMEITYLRWASSTTCDAMPALHTMHGITERLRVRLDPDEGFFGDRHRQHNLRGDHTDNFDDSFALPTT